MAPSTKKRKGDNSAACPPWSPWSPCPTSLEALRSEGRGEGREQATRSQESGAGARGEHATLPRPTSHIIHRTSNMPLLLPHTPCRQDQNQCRIVTPAWPRTSACAGPAASPRRQNSAILFRQCGTPRISTKLQNPPPTRLSALGRRLSAPGPSSPIQNPTPRASLTLRAKSPRDAKFHPASKIPCPLQPTTSSLTPPRTKVV